MARDRSATGMRPHAADEVTSGSARSLALVGRHRFSRYMLTFALTDGAERATQLCAQTFGDAAHAMTPNLGQGACQAVQDAVVLGQLLDSRAGADVSDGLGAYDRLRRRRTQMIAQRSHRIGAVAQCASPVAVGLRNTWPRAFPGRTVTDVMAPRGGSALPPGATGMVGCQYRPAGPEHIRRE